VGESELVDGKTGRIAVYIGARVASHAADSEVLVSGTVKNVVAGSDPALRGPRDRDGEALPGEWRLHAVGEAATDATADR
jgi:hypothetical protein